MGISVLNLGKVVKNCCELKSVTTIQYTLYILHILKDFNEILF